MNSAFDRDVWAIFGMPIDNVSLDEAASLVEYAFVLRNPECELDGPSIEE